MIINLSPNLDAPALTVKKKGDVLTINGEVFDFSPLPDGATLPASAMECESILGDVERVNGELNITLLLPITPDSSGAARFPSPIIRPANGLLEFPK
ncbi:hypothetical protein [Pseudomonas reactans]|uniref:hypothetical protein n=1 Tax=Pseudomonas reactans TaxID=117680 RepID=UPI0015A290DD|nr:hypothetical protein [Pseudomonas reactans]NWA68007.1 hypothetical protein [Pseudomonas reactans]